MNMSAEAKDLIQRLLKKNPKERPSLDEIMNHPFMNNRCRNDIIDSGLFTMSTVPSLNLMTPSIKVQPQLLPKLRRSNSNRETNTGPVMALPKPNSNSTGKHSYAALYFIILTISYLINHLFSSEPILCRITESTMMDEAVLFIRGASHTRKICPPALIGIKKRKTRVGGTAVIIIPASIIAIGVLTAATTRHVARAVARTEKAANVTSSVQPHRRVSIHRIGVAA